MPSNESIATPKFSDVFLLSSPRLTAATGPRTFLSLTPTIFVQICYLSLHELPSIKNKLEVKLTKEQARSLQQHFVTNLLNGMQLSIIYGYLRDAHDFISWAANKLEANEAEYLYVSIPLLTKEGQVFSTTCHAGSALLRYHRILFGSLMFATCITDSQVFQSKYQLPTTLDATKLFFKLPEFSVIINGVPQSPCAVCNQSKETLQDHKSCIFYSSNYECLFTSELPIVCPELQVSKLASIMASLDDSDLHLLENASTEDELENAWLRANPEYATLTNPEVGGTTNDIHSA